MFCRIYLAVKMVDGSTTINFIHTIKGPLFRKRASLSRAIIYRVWIRQPHSHLYYLIFLYGSYTHTWTESEKTSFFVDAGVINYVLEPKVFDVDKRPHSILVNFSLLRGSRPPSVLICVSAERPRIISLLLSVFLGLNACAVKDRLLCDT